MEEINETQTASCNCACPEPGQTCAYPESTMKKALFLLLAWLCLGFAASCAVQPTAAPTSTPGIPPLVTSTPQAAKPNRLTREIASARVNPLVCFVKMFFKAFIFYLFFERTPRMSGRGGVSPPRVRDHFV